MPRRANTGPTVAQQAAQAALDDIVSTAIGEVAASVSRGQGYNAEMAEIDETIERLRRRRAGLYGLQQEHLRAHPEVKVANYARVYVQCQAAGLAPGRMLQIAAQMEFGTSPMAAESMAAALRVGREVLWTLDDEPCLAVGHVFLATHGMWYGGRTTSMPRVELLGDTFVIAIPMMANGVGATCHMSIKTLVRQTPDGFVPSSQVYIGDERIVTGLAAHLKGVAAGSDDYAHALASLQDAGYGLDRSRSMLAAIDN